MKKLTQKIASVALAVVSMFFIILILVVMFEGIDIKEITDSKLVHALIFIMFGVFVILTTIAIWLAFVEDERLSDILLFKDRESATKATVGVVKKTAKRVCKGVEESKIRKVVLHSDSSGNVSMNVEVKIASDETMAVITRLRALLIKTFDEVFGIEFASINFKVVKSKNTFVPGDKEVQAKIEEIKASLVSNKQEMGAGQQSSVTGDITPEEIDAFIGKEDSTDESAEESSISDETIAEQEPETEKETEQSVEDLQEVQAIANEEEDEAIELKSSLLEEEQEDDKPVA